jgi:hypothetical protein
LEKLCRSGQREDEVLERGVSDEHAAERDA